MSFKDYDKKTFIADTARDFAARRISKRDFMKKMALAGVGFSVQARGTRATLFFLTALTLIATYMLCRWMTITSFGKVLVAERGALTVLTQM